MLSISHWEFGFIDWLRSRFFHFFPVRKNKTAIYKKLIVFECVRFVCAFCTKWDTWCVRVSIQSLLRVLRRISDTLNAICIVIVNSQCTVRLWMIWHLMQMLTMFSGKCVQEFLHKEMYKTQTNCRKSKYAECYTAAVEFH